MNPPSPHERLTELQRIIEDEKKGSMDTNILYLAGEEKGIVETLAWVRKELEAFCEKEATANGLCRNAECLSKKEFLQFVREMQE